VQLQANLHVHTVKAKNVNKHW